MKPFTYVMSGAAHARITLNSAKEEKSAAAINSVLSKAEQLFDNHKFTVLYNAYTEANRGKTLFEGGFVQNPMHADSGGLQIVTRGHKITDEIKDKVYAAQAAYSGVAMCFDEIPVEVRGQSKIGDLDNRFFRPDLVRAKANETAKNVIRQAEVFDKLGTKSKIMLIVQGNDYDSYLEWVDECIKTIPSDVYPFIGGMSFAGSSAGTGQVEDIERYFAFASAETPECFKKSLHLLGVGSNARMLPLVSIMKSGIMDDVEISYDSTSHSMRVSNRIYFDEENKVLSCTENDLFNITKLYNYCKSYFDIQSDFEQFSQIITYNRDNFLTKYGEDNIHNFHEALIAGVMVSILHATKQLDQLRTNNRKYKDFLVKKKALAMLPLTEVKTREEFGKYMNEFSKYLTSSRIKKLGENSTLDSFFQ